ncbi:MAG: lipopolysaccharide heptosyltransferase family protein [Acidobacteria bacterium]|nr:lipopolysaccharide heptosyltransferase family protein [Acidobacteriota bacterium]
MDRILLVRLGALGDLVHGLPVAAALRRAWPKARIDWLVSAKHVELLNLVPVLDRRLAVNDRGGADRGASLLAVVRELRRSWYDVAIDMQGLIKSAALARFSGARCVVGFSRRHVREPLAAAFYTDRQDPGGFSPFTARGVQDGSPVQHVVHLNLSLLTPLGVLPGPLEFPIGPVESQVARQVQESVGGPYVLLNPGAAWPNKRWPADRFGALAAAMFARHHLRSVVLWGPGERALADAVVAHAGGAAMASPETRVADIVALARGATLMVSGDTGPTHIAAAVGTPIVGLFGPTRPERNGPWAAGDIAVSRAASCECHHRRRCVRATMCLMDVRVQEVLDAVARRIGSLGKGAADG